MSDVVELDSVEPRTADVSDEDVDVVTDGQRVPAVLVPEADGRDDLAEELADQRAERGGHPAELAAHEPAHAVELLVVGALVEQEAKAPAALAHHGRCV